MNGAQAIIDTLVEAGAVVCFANPGTSELHLVEALERAPGMHTVACLTEGVATGAADGFGRMTGAPALALLHQGPGLANGLANLHNARRAGTALVVLVGSSSSEHVQLDAPLETHIESLALPMSVWVATAGGPNAALAAWQAALTRPRGPATLVVPADVAWSAVCEVAFTSTVPAPGPTAIQVSEVPLDRIRRLLVSDSTALLVGSSALTRVGLDAIDRIAQVTGVRVFCESFPARQARGADTPELDRLSSDPSQARAQLVGVADLVLIDTSPPVAAFGEPGALGQLWHEQCSLLRPADAEVSIESGLERLADLVAAGVSARPNGRTVGRSDLNEAPLTVTALAGVVASFLPTGAVVVDESNTAGPELIDALTGAAPHDLLSLCGFAIGQGLPLATGAALACPGRPVFCLEADGSALYTIPALWTQARERLDVTTIILDNRGYAILRREAHRRLGGELTASPLFDLGDPDIDFSALAVGFGVPAVRVTTPTELDRALRWAAAEPGPHLIHAVVRTPLRDESAHCQGKESS